MSIIAGIAKDLVAAVHLAADSSQVAAGTIYAVIRLESDDADDGKYWDADDDTWQAVPVAWPTATHTQAGQWLFALIAAATSGKVGDSIHYTFTDDLTEATATTVCGGGEHLIAIEGPIISADLVDLIWDEILTGATHNIANSSGKRLRDIASPVTHDGTAQGPGTGNNQIQLAVTASAVDGTYDPSVVVIVDGTGAGQSRYILEYVGATRTCIVGRDWKMNPAADSEYLIFANPGHEHVNEGLAQGATAGTFTLNALAASVDGVYIGQTIYIRGGLGADQKAVVTAYNGTTKVAVIYPDWVIPPDVTSTYVMLPVGQNVPVNGSRAVTLHTQEADTTIIPEGSVSIWTDALHTNLVTRAVTDLAGDYTLGLDDGVYYFTAVKSGYSFVSGTFTISADGVQNIIGVLWVPSAASAANLCMIFGTLRDTAGVPHDGICVEAWGIAPQVVNGIQLTTRISSIWTNAVGYFEMELEKEARVQIVALEAKIDSTKDVPDAANQNITTWADAVL